MVSLWIGRGHQLVPILMIADVVIGFALMGSILFQTGYSAGISGAFGGGMPQTMSSKKKGLDEFLERVALILGILFAVLTAVLAHFW